MNELELLGLLIIFFFGFIWGGIFFFHLGEQRANKKNLEDWNRYLGQQVKTNIIKQEK